jgi:uncharacterized protein
MKVFLSEITEHDTDLDFTQEEKWVSDAVLRVDEAETPSDKREISVHFNLRQVDDVVVVNGDIDTHVELICSRCATPYRHAVQPAFSALFCKDPVMAGIAFMPDKGDKPSGQNHGYARHAHDETADDDSSKELDITYLSEDFVNLQDVLTEQLTLQIPFQPLCKEDCRGICSHCGADLNRGRCACAKLAAPNAFAALGNLKSDLKHS